MRFPKKGVRDTIIYNATTVLSGIPLEAYDYVVNGKSAIEWIMERYAVTTDKKSGIVNDPNDWCSEHNNPRYIIDLLKRVIRVSLETNRLVASLPLAQRAALSARPKVDNIYCESRTESQHLVAVMSLFRKRFSLRLELILNG